MMSYRSLASTLMVAILMAVTLAWASPFFAHGSIPPPAEGVMVAAFHADVGHDADLTQVQAVADDHEVEDATVPASLSYLPTMAPTHCIDPHGEPSRRDHRPTLELRPPIG
jgi:hypothetical protein